MMVTWMHWMLANMAFIIVSNAKNLLMDNPTPGISTDHEAIGQIGGKYFARYKAEMETQGIERAREICENVNGVLATQLDYQQFQFIFEMEKLFFRQAVKKLPFRRPPAFVSWIPTTTKTGRREVTLTLESIMPCQRTPNGTKFRRNPTRYLLKLLVVSMATAGRISGDKFIVYIVS